MFIRRRFVPVALLIGLIVASVAGWMGFRRWTRPRWNVVVVTFDTTRADHIACYGHRGARTPALDELAQRGVLFERAYAPAPLTLPSHATLFTGLHPAEHGLVTNGKGRLGSDVTTFAEILSQKGCSTAAFVAAFVLNAKFGLNQGMNTYDDNLSGTPRTRDQLHRERSGQAVVDSALKWLAVHKRERFHCWIHLYDPHHPYLTHEDLFGDEFTERPYDAEIAYADRQLSRVLEFLRAEDLDRDTLIVIAGDHGEGLGEHDEPNHGNLLYASTLHVPLIIATPTATSRIQGVRVKEPVPLLDVFPTLLELLGLPVPRETSGRSLAGLWKGESVEPRECLAMTDEPFLDNGWSPLRSLTTSDWKYIRTPRVELYDLRIDSAETTNRAAENPAIVAELEAQLAAREQQMNRREAPEAALSDKEKQALASLGYTGGLTVRSSANAASDVDVKDMLPLSNKLAAAIEWLEQGRSDVAEPMLREIVQAAPTYLKALGNLGICLAQQGKLDEAIECYRRVLKIDAKDSSALMNLGAALAAQGKPAAAIKHYRLAFMTDRDSAVSALRLGLLYQETGDVSAASRMFAEAIERDPESEEAYRAWGDLEAALGNLDKARQHYDAGLAIDPDSIPTLVNRGILDARRGNFSSAKAFLQRALTIAPQDIPARQNLGILYEKEGHPAEAAAEYEAVVKEQPEHLPALLSLGWLRAAHTDDAVRRGEQAVELAERACRITNWQFAPALDLLAASYAELGRFDDAEKTVTTALKYAQQGAPPPPSVGELVQRRQLYLRRLPFRSRTPVKTRS